MPDELRHRHRVLDASGWFAVTGILAFFGAMWGPEEFHEFHELLAVFVAVMAAAASLHSLARPALLRWANPSRELQLPGETEALLTGAAVRSVGVATGTVSAGGAEGDDLWLRVGSRVLLSPLVADVDDRRLAALALTALRADRGVTSPTLLWACVAVLAGVNGRSIDAALAATLACAFVGLGIWHAWRSRWPDDAALARAGMDAVLFTYLLRGWAQAARSAREDPQHAAHLWQVWVTTARDPEERTDGLTADDVDAELARLPRLDR